MEWTWATLPSLPPSLPIYNVNQIKPSRSVQMFRQILKTKHVSDGDISEMIEGEQAYYDIK